MTEIGNGLQTDNIGYMVNGGIISCVNELEKDGQCSEFSFGQVLRHLWDVLI